MTPADTYRAARKEGMGTADACAAVRKAHPSVSFDDVVHMSWRIETGKPEPKWVDEAGQETAASKAWDRGFERRNHGEEE